MTTEKLEYEEILSGTFQLYNGDLRLTINEPIKQEVFINGSIMSMYYPQSNTLIELIEKMAFDLPIISSIAPLFKKDYGLSDIGFILDDYKTMNDSTVSTWIPKISNDQNIDSFFKLIYVSKQLHRVQHNSKLNQLNIVTNLHEYNKIAGLQIPTIIHTAKKINNEEVTEIIELSSITWQTNERIYLTLNIPDNAIKKQYSF